MNPKEIIVSEKSSSMSIFQGRPLRYRLWEIAVYVIALMGTGLFVNSQSTLYKVLAVLFAILIIGGAQPFYRMVLQPEYTLTKKELIIRIRKKTRTIPLTEVEKAGSWKPAHYLIQGKKESLMVSPHFITKLSEQLQRIHKSKRR